MYLSGNVRLDRNISLGNSVIQRKKSQYGFKIGVPRWAFKDEILQRANRTHWSSEMSKKFFLLLSFQVHNSIKNISLYGNILTIFDCKVKSLEVINYIQKISLLDSVLELQVNILIYYGDSLYFSKQII